jgi:hypothetical protein
MKPVGRKQQGLRYSFPGAGLHPVAQSAENVQPAVKDSKKYATGGWGFADSDGKPATRHCTKLASPVTSSVKIATTSSPLRAYALNRSTRRLSVGFWQILLQSPKLRALIFLSQQVTAVADKYGAKLGLPRSLRVCHQEQVLTYLFKIASAA